MTARRLDALCESPTSPIALGTHSHSQIATNNRAHSNSQATENHPKCTAHQVVVLHCLNSQMSHHCVPKCCIPRAPRLFVHPWQSTTIIDNSASFVLKNSSSHTIACPPSSPANTLKSYHTTCHFCPRNVRTISYIWHRLHWLPWLPSCSVALYHQNPLLLMPPLVTGKQRPKPRSSRRAAASACTSYARVSAPAPKRTSKPSYPETPCPTPCARARVSFIDWVCAGRPYRCAGRLPFDPTMATPKFSFRSPSSARYPSQHWHWCRPDVSLKRAPTVNYPLRDCTVLHINSPTARTHQPPYHRLNTSSSPFLLNLSSTISIPTILSSNSTQLNPTDCLRGWRAWRNIVIAWNDLEMENVKPLFSKIRFRPSHIFAPQWKYIVVNKRCVSLYLKVCIKGAEIHTNSIRGVL